MQTSEISSIRIYAMAAMFNGDIVVAGNSINVYRIYADGTVSLIRSMDNSNVIDDVIPLPAYKILTVDRQGNHAGTLKLWNLLDGTYTFQGTSRIDAGSDTTTFGHVCVSPDRVISYAARGLYTLQLQGMLRLPGPLAEVRKCARLLAQAKLSPGSAFERLPDELCLKIATMTGQPFESAASVARDHFG